MTCAHTEIRSWVIQDTGEPANFWSCRECGLKFAPMAETERAAVIACEQIANEADEWHGESAIAIKQAYPQHFDHIADDGKKV